MPDVDGRLLLEMLRLRLMEAAREDLSLEKDERLALRKALLMLILMTQEEAGPVAKAFIEYLIQDFPALASRFSATHDHLLMGKHAVGRRASADGQLVLSLEKKLVDSLLGKPINEADLAFLGRVIPWETTAERYVGFYDIMGFRAFMERYGGDHGRIHGILEQLHNVAIRAEEMHSHGGDGLHPVYDHRGSQLRVIQFSDSILHHGHHLPRHCPFRIRCVICAGRRAAAMAIAAEIRADHTETSCEQWRDAMPH